MLRIFAKLTCFSTLLLIFIGGMVTSTGSGLAVPDWPLSYGTFFPPMVGGVFYEHGHRMVASLIGFMMLVLCIWLWIKEERRWVKILGSVALLAVILQGVLGGITVLFYLPTPVSVAHGVLAQTFFLMTILLSYSLSFEFNNRQKEKASINASIIKGSVILVGAIYIQLILGAVMRHTHSGLAIYDFPKMGGEWIPLFNQKMLTTINDWRFMNGLENVTLNQIIYHFAHRLWALVIIIIVCYLNWIVLNCKDLAVRVKSTLATLNAVIIIQILLGIITVLSMKTPIITSLHVFTGAATLGISFLFLLRVAPISFFEFKKVFFKQ
ncbi:MAG: COX15/CtaA family protein [Candidatus Omnitrophica bacterium]|nr:COX15/CtaA family protein [Candidatus Omnitrophota bacterium]